MDNIFKLRKDEKRRGEKKENELVSAVKTECEREK